MKIFPVALSFLSIPLTIVSAPAQTPPTESISFESLPNETLPLFYDTFDYYDFSAMQKTPAGRALRERIFGDLKNAPDTSALLRLLNENYGMPVPQCVERAILAKFSFRNNASLNSAEFEFSEKEIVASFLDNIRKQAFPWENYPNNINSPTGKNLSQAPQAPFIRLESTDFSLLSASAGTRKDSRPEEITRNTKLPEGTIELPPNLAQTLPPSFLEKATQVLVFSPTENRISVVASSKPILEKIPDFPHVKGYAESLGEASSPGVLIYRKFARRTATISGFALSFPPGEFIISEQGDRTRICVDFHCQDMAEAAFMEHFFLRFKISLLASAEKQPKPTKSKLLSVGQALTLSLTGTNLKLQIDCSSEDFPAFLQWRSSWFPKP